MPKPVSTPIQPPSGILLSQSEISGLRERGYSIEEPIRPYPWQNNLLTRLEREIGLFGGKYGGKTMGTMLWLLSGNPHLPDTAEDGTPILVNRSYVYHPAYRSLVIRKNQEDLRDYIERYSRVAYPYGGRYRDGVVSFPSGAYTAFGHAKDRESWQKYIGVETIRLIVEEAALIPELKLYLELISTVRSPYPEMRAQIVLTSNAGGPGTSWIIDRFIEVKDAQGDPIPPGTTIVEQITNPLTGETAELTRVWLFSTILNNPAAANDPGYALVLASMPPKQRAAYLHGQWSGLSGVYFDIFRPRGPHPGEAPNANHVIQPCPERLRPWWHRAISLDWGRTHEAAILWGCHVPDTFQTHVEQEYIVSGATPQQLGYELAIRTLPILKSSQSTRQSITCWISPDAYHNREGAGTLVEQIARGVQKVLGPRATHIPDLDIRRLRESYEEHPSHLTIDERERMFDSIRAQRRMGIVFRMAIDDRIVGWNAVYDMLRWVPLFDALSNTFDPNVASNILLHDGLDAWLAYHTLHAARRPEVLPKLQIWSSCPRLIDALPRLVHDDKKPEDASKQHFRGLDVLDSLRYLVMGMREETPAEPREAWMERRLNASIERDPTVLDDPMAMVWINRQLEAAYDRSHLKTFMPPRGGRRTRLLIAGQNEPTKRFPETPG